MRQQLRQGCRVDAAFEPQLYRTDRSHYHARCGCGHDSFVGIAQVENAHRQEHCCKAFIDYALQIGKLSMPSEDLIRVDVKLARQGPLMFLL